MDPLPRDGKGQGLRVRVGLVSICALLASTLAAPAALAHGSAPPSAQTGPSGSAATPLTEADSPIVIEAGPLLAPGPDGGLPEGVQEAMEDHILHITASSAVHAAQDGGLPSFGAAAGGGIAVTYNPTYPAPGSVRAVVDAAVSSWDAVLATNPAGPVVVEVFWSNLGNPSLLGYAGPDGMFHGGGLPTSSLYPAALANTLLGLDANGSGRPEVQVVLNAELLASNRWYLGTTGAPSGSQIDLYSVALHEIGHGLGFLGSATVPGGQSQPSLSGTPYAYDVHAHHGGTPITAAADPVAALTSGDVHISFSDAHTHELYAPGTWTQGSSFSHFDEGAYPAGAPGALMTPMLGSGETARVLDAPVIGVMARIGWPTTAAVITPSIVAVSPSLTAAVVSWSTTLGITGLAPDSYTVQAWLDGTTLQSSVTVPGSASSATVPSLSPGRAYTIKVTPSGPNGLGASATSTVQLGVASGPADPAQWPSFIRDLPLDGQINRLYQAYFLRLADEAGFQYWLDQRARWTSLADISSAFAASNEFQNRYGALNDEAFVDLVYANVLGRVADPGGRAYWLSQLAGGATRGQVMIGFAESTEYVARTGTAAATSPQEARIRRLYNAFFRRDPDAAGLAYWADQATAGVPLEAIAGAFAQSGEFATTYGPLSDTEFVQLVYRNVLGRDADAGGLTYWTALLAGGTDRGTVMVGFSESAEFIKSTGTIP